jgi:hypothetical protein
MSVLGMLIESAKDVTATQDILGGDAGRGTMPVGTVSALIEQGLKTFTAIVKRIHRALKKELKILYRLNGRYLEPEVYFTFQDQEGVVAQQDYAEGDMDVIPMSDPNMATDMQRMQQAQFKLEVAKQAGGNVPAAGKSALRAARVAPDEIEEIFPEQKGPPPPDPKAVEAAAKADNAAKQTEIDRARAISDIAYKNAQTEELEAQIAAFGPDAMAIYEQAMRGAIQNALAMVENGGNPAPVQQQGPVPGVAGPPADGPVPPVPGGPAGGPDGAMGPGPGDEPGFPGQGGPPMAANGAGLA